MKIYIKTNEGKKFKIPLPMWLIRFGLSKPVIRRLTRNKKGKNGMKYLEGINFSALSKELKILKKYKGMKIVDVKSSTGEIVEIKI